jgi:hypothetical protein
LLRVFGPQVAAVEDRRLYESFGFVPANEMRLQFR